MNWLFVIAGAAVGAPLRYLVDRLVQSRHDTDFPWGVCAVNAAGSLVLGVVTAAALDPGIALLIGTGFCGALTTYSTLTYDTVRLSGTGARFHAVAGLAVSIGSGLGAYLLGTAVAQAIWS